MGICGDDVVCHEYEKVREMVNDGMLNLDVTYVTNSSNFSPQNTIIYNGSDDSYRYIKKGGCADLNFAELDVSNPVVEWKPSIAGYAPWTYKINRDLQRYVLAWQYYDNRV